MMEFEPRYNPTTIGRVLPFGPWELKLDDWLGLDSCHTNTIGQVLPFGPWELKEEYLVEFDSCYT